MEGCSRSSDAHPRGSEPSSACLLCTVEETRRVKSLFAGQQRRNRLVVSHLKFIRHILLVERVETHKLEAFCHDVEGLVVSFGANCHLVCADLRQHRSKV